jgi:hypothetical protein
MYNAISDKSCILVLSLIIILSGLNYTNTQGMAFAQGLLGGIGGIGGKIPCLSANVPCPLGSLGKNLPPPPFDLTGVYSSNDGGKYYIQQKGYIIFWVGLSSDNGKTFTNVFHGTIQPDMKISGSWSDVPLGRLHNSGTLILAINQDRSLQKISELGGFSGSSWHRISTLT